MKGNLWPEGYLIQKCHVFAAALIAALPMGGTSHPGAGRSPISAATRPVGSAS